MHPARVTELSANDFHSVCYRNELPIPGYCYREDVVGERQFLPSEWTRKRHELKTDAKPTDYRSGAISSRHDRAGKIWVNWKSFQNSAARIFP
jgi:hypothetical protein